MEDDMRLNLLAFPILIALSGAVHATDRLVDATDAQSFHAAAAALRTELTSDNGLALSGDERRAVEADIAQMQRLMEHYGSTQSLNLVTAVRYFNAQEHLNGLLSGDLAQRRQCIVFANRALCGSYAWLHSGARYVRSSAAGAGFVYERGPATPPSPIMYGGANGGGRGLR
jgi:hypothetical protein